MFSLVEIPTKINVSIIYKRMQMYNVLIIYMLSIKNPWNNSALTVMKA